MLLCLECHADWKNCTGCSKRSKYWKIQRIPWKWRVSSTNSHFGKTRKSYIFRYWSLLFTLLGKCNTMRKMKADVYPKIVSSFWIWNLSEDLGGSQNCTHGRKRASNLHTLLLPLGCWAFSRAFEWKKQSWAGKTVNTKTNIIKSTPESFRTACTFCGQCQQHYFTFLQLVCWVLLSLFGYNTRMGTLN